MKGKQIRIISLLVIDTIFFFLEVSVGYAVHSLALIADSFHMLNDIISLVVALWAVNVAKTKGADSRYTYGWKRAEILGALVNAVFLIALCFSILIEAIQRLISPAIITNPKLILYVGTAGLVSNIVGLFLFHEHGHSHGGGGHSHSHGDSNDEDDDTVSESPVLPEVIVNAYDETSGLLEHSKSKAYSDLEQGHSHSHDHDHDDHVEDSTKKTKKQKSMNMEGVFLHVLGDALGNVGVILTALFIWKTNYSWKYYSDPLISLVITAIILSSAIPLCRRASRILLQATPSTINADEVQNEVLKVDGVKSVHDLHIWNLTEDIFIASLHIEVDANPETFLVIASEIRSVLHDFGIHSATVQPEFIGQPNISGDAYQQFTKIASGKYSSRNNSIQNLQKAIDSSRNGSEQCIVDSAVNCNTTSCLDNH